MEHFIKCHAENPIFSKHDLLKNKAEQEADCFNQPCMRWCDARTLAGAILGISNCGAPLIPVIHQCSYLRSTAQPCVPLENIKKGCVWSTSGFLTMGGYPEDELTCSEFWVPHTVPSETRSSLSVLVWHSGEVVIHLLPGDIECHSEHPCVYSVQTPCIWNNIKHNLWENVATLHNKGLLWYKQFAHALKLRYWYFCENVSNVVNK